MGIIGAPPGRLGHNPLFKECRKGIPNPMLAELPVVPLDDDSVEIVDPTLKYCRLKRGIVTDSHATDGGCKPYARGNNLDRDGHESEEGEPKTKGHDGLITLRDKRDGET